MEKRSRQRVRDQVALTGLRGRVANEIGRARISMMARNTNVPFKGRIQKRKTYHLQIITFGLQRAAGPYKQPPGRGHPPGGAPPPLEGRALPPSVGVADHNERSPQR